MLLWGWQEVELKQLKLSYNKAITRYNKMEEWIKTASEEEQKKQIENVMDLIKECNDLLNQIKTYMLVTPGEILGGFKI